MSKKLYTIREASVILGVPYQSVYVNVRRGHIQSLRFGRRIWISEAEIERLGRGEPLPSKVQEAA